jgi:hypothetical protein
MNHYVKSTTDGYVHGCRDCGRELPPLKVARVAWICGCDQQIVMAAKTPRKPTITSRIATVTGNRTPPPARFRFKMPTPPCAYLGAETGEPIKIGCGGGGLRRLKECYCPTREHAVDKQTGLELPILAADNWWCGDLGNIQSVGPVQHQSCRTCTLRTPQKLLPAPEAPPEGPGWLQKGANLTKAYAKHIVTGMKEATDAQVDRRHRICATCPFYVKLDESQGECRKCGCTVGDSSVEGLNKLRLASEQCPLPRPRWKRLFGKDEP